RGTCYAVHTFNAMRSLSHRDPGIVAEVLADDRVFAEIIADGIHVDESVVRIFARAKGKSLVLLATDAISATDMPGGRYALGGETGEGHGGIWRGWGGRVGWRPITAGVGAPNFGPWARRAVGGGLAGVTLNPARALKLQRKGVLEPGADADVVIMD